MESRIEIPELSKENINQCVNLSVYMAVGNKEHKDILDKVRRTRDLAQSLFSDFHYTEFTDADHLGIWEKALPGIIGFFISIITLVVRQGFRPISRINIPVCHHSTL